MKLVTHTPRFVLAAVLCAIAVTLWPTEASAQRRGHGGRARGSTVVVAPALYYGYGFYDPFWWGYGVGYPYGWYAPYYPGIPYRPNVGSARLQIKPSNAEVYVDGHLAGIADDFDGFLQRLDLPAGEHELTVYREGYRTLSQKVLFRPGATLNIKYTLQPLGPGESNEPRPQAVPDSPSASEERPAPAATAERPRASDFGTLAVRVQPGDATLTVDGEEWAASRDDAPVLIELREGNHEIEVRKPGFSTFRRTVRVRSGETVSLNVSLSR